MENENVVRNALNFWQKIPPKDGLIAEMYIALEYAKRELSRTGAEQYVLDTVESALKSYENLKR